ncbi:DUF4349 domain-containing protein [Candidatus Formimonas warabiya]|uniref:DUF4349 domain-containing protein n=1 Tax=Formimonas warabiya TaxID=1761012 RepID=A0A3G1KPD2_FORW1|nr:DUF4349 domain-containing protein [Candidatus Formimonas warabiya]ATW24296.1 hypothetical protein DCMF_05375 [Candidatus Formimonas warabiya]
MKKALVLFVLILFCVSGCGSINQSAKENSGRVENSSSVAYDEALTPEAGENSERNNTSEVKNLERKIIQNAEIKLRVEDLDAVCDRIKNKTIELEGYPNDYTVVTNENQSNASLSLKVPSTNYAQLLDFIVKQGKADFKREYTNDVTLEYIDLDARVKVLKTEEDSLLTILNKAEKIDDILKIKAQITATRQERESLEGQLKALHNSIEYATILVTLYQPANSEINVNVENLNIFSRCGRALVYGFNSLTGAIGSVMVWFFTALPALALLTLILLGVLLVRKNRKSGQ